MNGACDRSLARPEVTPTSLLLDCCHSLPRLADEMVDARFGDVSAGYGHLFLHRQAAQDRQSVTGGGPHRPERSDGQGLVRFPLAEGCAGRAVPLDPRRALSFQVDELMAR